MHLNLLQALHLSKENDLYLKRIQSAKPRVQNHKPDYKRPSSKRVKQTSPPVVVLQQRKMVNNQPPASLSSFKAKTSGTAIKSAGEKHEAQQHIRNITALRNKEKQLYRRIDRKKNNNDPYEHPTYRMKRELQLKRVIQAPDAAFLTLGQQNITPYNLKPNLRKQDCKVGQPYDKFIANIEYMLQEEVLQARSKEVCLSGIPTTRKEGEEGVLDLFNQVIQYLREGPMTMNGLWTCCGFTISSSARR